MYLFNVTVDNQEIPFIVGCLSIAGEMSSFFKSLNHEVTDIVEEAKTEPLTLPSTLQKIKFDLVEQFAAFKGWEKYD